MTIEVLITNKDTTRRIEVVEISFDKYLGTTREAAPTMIGLGEARSFYIHNLKDLRLREAHPDLQGRAKP